MKEKIQAQLLAMGCQPKRALGQNFLISEHVIAKILVCVQRLHPQGLVEVGPGLGALTEGLRQLQKPLVVIELDRDFANYWRQIAGVEVREADALQLNWGADTALSSADVLVSNLPYQISSSLVIERSINTLNLRAMILMFQKEVAQRLVARAATPEYGLLSVIAQAQWSVEFLLEAGPRDFYPAPNVASRVLLFKANPQLKMGEGAGFLTMVKAAFAHRRKYMYKNLAGGLSQWAVPWDKVFDELNLDRKMRAEELDPSGFLRLYQACRSAKG